MYHVIPGNFLALVICWLGGFESQHFAHPTSQSSQRPFPEYSSAVIASTDELSHWRGLHWWLTAIVASLTFSRSPTDAVGAGCLSDWCHEAQCQFSEDFLAIDSMTDHPFYIQRRHPLHNLDNLELETPQKDWLCACV
jgi:hypothetical protein